MFTSLKLFKDISCPEENNFTCNAPNCLFRHSDQNQLQDHGTGMITATASPSVNYDHEGPRKRRKVLDNKIQQTAKDQASKDAKTGPSDQIGSQGITGIADQAIRSGTDRSSGLSSRESTFIGLGLSRPDVCFKPALPIHATIPPPPLIFQSLSGDKQSSTSKKDETLNPRIVRNPPAKHDFRLRILKMWHEQHVRLYEQHKQDHTSALNDINLSKQDLIKLVLNEEEASARNNPAIYQNVVKNRLVALKKMKVDEWRKEMLAAKTVSSASIRNPDSMADIEAGLSSPQEIAILSQLKASPEQLNQMDFVLSVPSEEDLARTTLSIAAAKGWEVCDRCSSRFEVFPGRRESDGALTAGGNCQYHYGRLLFPTRKHDDVNTGARDRLWSCCSELPGSSAGCSTAPTHVFKVTEVKRLATTLQFTSTPANEQVPTDRALCLDCEMCYTVYGLELVRMTATQWPSGLEFIDILVRPLGEILDLNTRFSGITQDQIAKALGGTSEQSEKDGIVGSLSMVASPRHARDLLLAQLAPKSPLIGHALENDLKALRLIHPTIVDSSILFPHPRGPPYRNGLKMLMMKTFDRAIQINDSGQGHDSKEDARAAGDLVRWKVGKEWQKLHRQGWRVKGTDIIPPIGNKEQGKSIGVRPVSRPSSELVLAKTSDGEFEDGEVVE